MAMWTENDQKISGDRQKMSDTAANEITQQLSGHRPIVFSDVGNATLLHRAEMDVLLLRDNRIVASTAREGRYAAGNLFYARSPRRYPELLTVCKQTTCGAPMFWVCAHNRSVVLLSGALLSSTDFLLAVALHGNVHRTKRVITHCFSDVMTWLEDAGPQGPLRRGDERFYRALGDVLCLLRRLLYDCGSSIEITERGQLISLLQSRISDILPFLPGVAMTVENTELTDAHYPCLGSVDLAHTVASLLCFLLGAHGCFSQCVLRMEVSEQNRYPQFSLTVHEPLPDAPRFDRHTAIAEAMRLSLHHVTLFECRPIAGEAEHWRISFSPMDTRYGEMYTLRSGIAELFGS